MKNEMQEDSLVEYYYIEWICKGRELLGDEW